MGILLTRFDVLAVYMSICTLILCFFPVDQIERVQRILSLLMVVLVTFLMSRGALNVQSINLPGQEFYLIIASVISLFASIVLIKGLSRLANNKGGFFHFVFFLPFIGALCLLAYIPLQSYCGIVVVVFFCMQLRYVWHITTVHLVRNEGNADAWMGNYFSPFWNRTFYWFNPRLPADESERLRNIKAGARIILYAVIIRVGLLALEQVLPHEGIARLILTYPAIGTSTFSATDWTQILEKMRALSAGQLFLVCTIAFAHYTFQLIYLTSLIVGMGRLCGLSVLRFVYKPFWSPTFFTTLTRLNYHYVNMLWIVFIHPFICAFSFIRDQRKKYSLAVFCGVLLGGFIFHFCQWPIAFLQEGVGNYFVRYSGYIIYYLLIAAAAAISYFLAIRSAVNSEIPIRLSKFTFFLKNAFYFIIYALIFSTIATDFHIVTSWDRLKIWVAVLGL
jgi:hypothetical protein